MAENINLSFTDSDYSTSNPPSVVTLKDDLSAIEAAHNVVVADINDHESRITTAEADIVDVRGQMEGLLINGKIVTSVASNNLTVAIKTLAGSDPSVADPVYVRIGNTIRTLTTAKSVTMNAGTNWFASGGATTATKEIDYFVVMIWNTTPATDRLDIGICRTIMGQTYGMFSATTTSSQYLAFSGSDAPASTDEVRVCGRFNAVLSATASFNWSIPATSIIVQHPVFETRWLTWLPAAEANGAMTWTSVTFSTALYKLDGGDLEFQLVGLGTTGGTPNTDLRATMPLAPLSVNFGGGCALADVSTIGGVWRINATTGTGQIYARRSDLGNITSSSGIGFLISDGHYTIA